METHHKIHVADFGSNKRNNQVLLHLHCHDQYHAKFTRIKHEERRNNKNLAAPYREMSDIQAELMGII
jgi:hypothetical protein